MPTPSSLVLAALLQGIICLNSCTNKNAAEESKLAELSLMNSIDVINLSTQQIMKSLDEKSMDPLTKERAEIWLPKAKQVSHLSDDMFTYLETAKQDIADKRLSVDSVKNKLMTYKEELFSVDSSIRLNFDKIPAFDFSLEKVTTLTITALQNNIKVIQNKIIAYCHVKTQFLRHHDWSQYSPLITQNSGILKPGDILKINAGIGALSKASMPEITIGGTIIPLEPEGFALYQTTVNNPGKHKIPVIIKYYDQYKNKYETRVHDIEYTVTKPCPQ